MNEEIESGLLEDVHDLDPVALAPVSPIRAADSDGTDTADDDGTDTGDADGTDGEETAPMKQLPVEQEAATL